MRWTARLRSATVPAMRPNASDVPSSAERLPAVGASPLQPVEEAGTSGPCEPTDVRFRRVWGDAEWARFEGRVRSVLAVMGGVLGGALALYALRFADPALAAFNRAVMGSLFRHH